MANLGISTLDNLTSGLDINKLVELVRVAETAERYEDMCRFVKKLIELKSSKSEDLDVDQRNLFSVAYKNVVGTKRASWRTLSGGFDDADQELVNKYKIIIEDELEMICQEVLGLLINYLCKNVEGNHDETEVFYLKMCGDYYRYLCEFATNRDQYKNSAEKFYQKAMDVADTNLNETHPTRLGLALNFSVFYREILNEPEKACDLAKKSFDSSIEKLDTLNDASYKDSTLIMQLLRDNLTSWTSACDEDDDGGTIGFAVGGARDVNNFRECIEKGIMPKNGSVTYNGLLYEYYFDTKKRSQNNNNNNKKKEIETKNDDEKKEDDGSMLFYPSYCYARINKLPFDDNKDNEEEEGEECEYYMTVGLNSNIKEKDFKRKLLNLVIVLDKSGSMSDCFDGERHSYYAQFDDNYNNNNNNNKKVKTKMEVANQCIVDLLKHLTPKDRFGLIVFDNGSAIFENLELIENIDLNKMKNEILNIKASGGTNFECGYNEAIKLYLNENNNIQNDEIYDNRIIFLTDAHPNHGITDPKSLMGLVDTYSNNKENYIYTTFIGVGLDFNAKLIEQISSTRGCNYYSVQSTDDFNKVMNTDFNFMVTPLVFNVCLKLKSEGDSCCIDKVYGTSAQNEENIIKTGEITKINTLFPSKKSKAKGGTKGGIQLIKLKNNNKSDNNNDKFNVEIEVTFEDKYGKLYKNEQYVTFKTDDDDNNNNNDIIENINFYDNIGIRKGILLCKYVELLMDWIQNNNNNNNGGNALQINDEYIDKFNQFIPHFEKEMKECNDNDLQKELDLLKKLVNNE